MTNICYTLEEAAEKLKFSETVLVRLSQYLKVPRAAYGESGYLSFKGDLAFSEQDLAFFTQVKERLLMGESLDDVKNRMPQYVASQVAGPGAGVQSETVGPVQINGDPRSAVPEAFDQEPDVLGGIAITAPGELPPMREIQDRKPYEKAAEKSFERYKSMHRSGIGKVFENMLKEVGGPQPTRKTGASTPVYKPMRGRAFDPEETPQPQKREDAMLPFSRWLGRDTEASSGPVVQPSVAAPQATRPPRIPMPKVAPSYAAGYQASLAPRKPVVMGAVWETLVHDAAQKPRTLNLQLKSAALLLRERTLGQTHQQGIV